MELGLKGKVAIVTGAGSPIGFGKAIALNLAKEGCDIVVADIDLKSAENTASDVKVLRRKAVAVKVDITNSAEVKNMVKVALEQFKRIDILVNNAGASSSFKPFVEKGEEDWDLDINVNLKGVLRCTSAVLPHMISQKSGKIINISSGAGKMGSPGVVTYGAAKAGIIAFSRGLAREVAPLGVLVNVVCPGVSNTGFGKNAPQGALENVAANTPVRRLTEPQDIGTMVTFLCSEVTNDICGQAISVDGGDIMV